MKDVFVVAYQDDTNTFELEREFECADEAHAYEVSLGSKASGLKRSCVSTTKDTGSFGSLLPFWRQCYGYNLSYTDP